MNQNNAAPPVLTDDEINAACGRHAADTGWHAENDRKKARAVESALLSKLRAPVADERAAFEAIVKRLGGDCTWRPGYGYVSSMTRLYQNFWQLAHVARGSK